MGPSMHAAARCGFLLAALMFARPCRADCNASYDAAQRLERAGKLRAAAHELITCAATTCPLWMQRDCVAWAQQNRERTPSVVVHALGSDGCDLSAATLDVDGERAADSLDGRPIPLDPGSHTLVLRAPDAATLETNIVLVEGGGARQVSVSFAPPGTTCAPRPAPAAVAPSEAPRSRAAPYVVGIAGLVLVGVGATLEIAGLVRKSALEDCRPGCSPSRVDAMMTELRMGDVFLGMGILTVGLATYLYLAAR